MKKCRIFNLFVIGGLLGFSCMAFASESSPDPSERYMQRLSFSHPADRSVKYKVTLDDEGSQPPYAYKLGCMVNATEDWENFQPEQEFLFVVQDVPQPEICGASPEECHEKPIPASFYKCIADGVCVHFPMLTAEYCAPVTSADPQYDITIWVNVVSGLSRNKSLKERFSDLKEPKNNWFLELWTREHNPDELQFANAGTVLPENSATSAYAWVHYYLRDQESLDFTSYAMECVAQTASQAEVEEALKSGSPQVVRHTEGAKVDLCDKTEAKGSD